MPLTTTFEFTTRTLQSACGNFGEASVITETRWVTRRDGAPLNLFNDALTMEQEGVLPRLGDDAFPSGTGLTWQQFCTFDGYAINQLPGAAGVEITLRWSTMYAMHPSASPAYYALPSSAEYQAQPKTTTVYRVGWTVNPPSSSNVSATDIGGTAVSGASGGMPWQVPQVRIRARFLQDANATSMINSATRLANYTGTTNNASFLGCAAYTLICEGVSVAKTQKEYYEVVFEFLYDPWFHHEQVASNDADGRPKRSSNNLAEVYWKRIPRTAVDFNDIYAGDTRLRAMTEKGWFN